MQIGETIRFVKSQEAEGIEVLVARSLEEVEALREFWAAWPSHRDSDIDFYLMIIKSYPEVVRPHVVVIGRAGKPEAILVGRIENRKLIFNVGYLRIPGPRVRCLTFVYGAIHGNASPENTEILLRDVIRSLKRREADVVMLEFVPLDSSLYRLALKLPGILNRDALPAVQSHDMMVIPGSIDEVYQRMSGKHRKNLRREVRQIFAEHVGARIVCYQSESELDRMFSAAEEIAKKTYQRGLRAGFADNPQVRQRLELAARKGWLRANLLYLGDRPVAFWIGMLYGQTFVSEYMGYDPEFRKWSPGMVLIMQVIEGFCNRINGDNVKELDFGLGHAQYKGTLRSRSWLEAPVYIFSPTLKGLVLKSMRSVTQLMDRSARKVLAFTRVFPRLKSAWRERLAEKANLQSSSERSRSTTVTRPAPPPTG